MRRLLPSTLLLIAGLPAADELPVLGDEGDVATVDEHQWTEAVSRRRQRLESAPQAVAVLDARDLRGSPAITLPDRLRYLAGVDVYQVRAGQWDVGLRGWNGLLNPRILVLADGQQYRQEEFGAVTWVGPLFPSDIARVEIAKGPSSVMYGANAFGGMVAIRGHEPSDRHRLMAVGSLGTPMAGEADATALGPLGGVGYYKLRAGWTRIDAFPGAPESGLARQDSPRTADSRDRDLLARRYSATIGLHLPARFRAEATYTGTDLDHWTLVDDLDIGANDTFSYYDDLLVRVVGPWAEASHLRHRARKAYQGQKTAYDPAADYQYIQAGFLDAEETSRLQINLPLKPVHLSLGGEYDRWESRSNLWNSTGVYSEPGSWGTVETRTASLFAEGQLSPAPGLTFTAGAREDRHTRVGANFSPRLALNWSPNADQFVLLTMSSGYRLPTPIESSIVEYYFRADPDLRAEKVRAVEAAWQGRWCDRQLSLGANVFAHRASQLIWLMPMPATEMQSNFTSWLLSGPDPARQPGPYLQYTNLDNPAWLLGAEASASWRLPDLPLTLWANTTWQHLRYDHRVIWESDGFPNPGVPSLPATIFRFHTDLGRSPNAPPHAKASLGAGWDDASWFGGAALRLVSARWATSIGNSTLPSEGDLLVQKVPAYACLDLTLGWSLDPARRSFVRVGVLDVLDTRHSEWFRSDAALLRRTSEDQNDAAIGRQVAVQAGWEF